MPCYGARLVVRPRPKFMGKWWATVSVKDRARSQAYMENQELIQKKWDKTWGDRLNEVVYRQVIKFLILSDYPQVSYKK
jgi:hypothetical protein